MSVELKIALDTRRPRKKKSTFPVVLQLRLNSDPYRYPTIFELTQECFQKLESPRISEELKDIRVKLRSIQCDADNYLKRIPTFNKTEFEKDFINNNPLFKPRKRKADPVPQDEILKDEKYLKKFSILTKGAIDPGPVSFVFRLCVINLILEGRLGTALSYQRSCYAFIKFKGDVTFLQITAAFLRQFESWMIERGKSKAYIGIIVREVRAMFNEAAELKLINKEHCYPFGKRRYRIPTGKNRKKALPMKDVETLHNINHENENVKKAVLYWLFSYYGNGMNTKDIAYLQYKNIEGDFIVFIRAKTVLTTKENPQQIVVFITKEMRNIISHLANEKENDDTYLFPILNEEMSLIEQYDRVRRFTAFINKYIKFVQEDLDYQSPLRTGEARHTFATVLKRAGASTEYIQEALGHMTKDTTQNYLDSFETDMKKQFAEQLGNFGNYNDSSS